MLARLPGVNAGAPVLFAWGANANGGFGDGPHRCPGSQVAMHETRVFLDRLLRVPGIRLVHAPQIGWSEMLMSYELRGAMIACDRS